MKPFLGKNFKSIAVVLTMAILFFSCKDNYKRAGQEKIPLVYPIGIAEDFTAKYTEATQKVETEDSVGTRVVAILKSPLLKDYTNLEFPYQTLPNSLLIDVFNENGGRFRTVQIDVDMIQQVGLVITGSCHAVIRCD